MDRRRWSWSGPSVKGTECKWLLCLSGIRILTRRRRAMMMRREECPHDDGERTSPPRSSTLIWYIQKTLHAILYVIFSKYFSISGKRIEKTHSKCVAVFVLVRYGRLIDWLIWCGLFHVFFPFIKFDFFVHFEMALNYRVFLQIVSYSFSFFWACLQINIGSVVESLCHKIDKTS